MNFSTFLKWKLKFANNRQYKQTHKHQQYKLTYLTEVVSWPHDLSGSWALTQSCLSCCLTSTACRMLRVWTKFSKHQRCRDKWEQKSVHGLWYWTQQTLSNIYTHTVLKALSVILNSKLVFFTEPPDFLAYSGRNSL